MKYNLYNITTKDMSNTLIVKKWTSETRDWTITANWTPVDITWYTFSITFRPKDTLYSTDDTDVVIQKNMTIVDAVNWLVSFTLTETDTDIEPCEYVWAVSFVDWNQPVWEQKWEQRGYIYLFIENNVDK